MRPIGCPTDRRMRPGKTCTGRPVAHTYTCTYPHTHRDATAHMHTYTHTHVHTTRATHTTDTTHIHTTHYTTLSTTDTTHIHTHTHNIIHYRHTHYTLHNNIHYRHYTHTHYKVHNNIWYFRAPERADRSVWNHCPRPVCCVLGAPQTSPPRISALAGISEPQRGPTGGGGIIGRARCAVFWVLSRRLPPGSRLWLVFPSPRESQQ